MRTLDAITCGYFLVVLVVGVAMIVVGPLAIGILYAAGAVLGVWAVLT